MCSNSMGMRQTEKCEKPVPQLYRRQSKHMFLERQLYVNHPKTQRRLNGIQRH
ncbi:hypothetical protein KL86CLO1_11373 [uncultured Eubacteriales bacterium]|uniref:Uncharacterized protein n=1 Tax=uncultured Eubacteriales bacterium TaxID=172733 RepID=A0A212JML8_9FIRM|nr:hypothetical protein KL86CLO1_11373 [uncultured Eubacteriales bacterium]